MELVLMIGLQGASKSTFARAHFADGYVYVSRDLLRNKPAQRAVITVDRGGVARGPLRRRGQHT